MGTDLEISNGEWSRGRGWAEGDWQIRAQATDSCGNQAFSEVFPLNVAYDCNASVPGPIVEIFAPTTAATRPVGWTAIRASAASSNRVGSVEFWYRQSGTAAWQSLGVDSEISNAEWSRGRAWPAGDWEVKAEATDACAKVGASSVVQFTVAD